MRQLSQTCQHWRRRAGHGHTGAGPGKVCSAGGIHTTPASIPKHFQLLEAARFIQGDDFLPDSLLTRVHELTETRDALRKKKAALLVERAAVLDTFAIDQKTLDRREAYFKAQAAFDLEEKGADSSSLESGCGTAGSA